MNGPLNRSRHSLGACGCLADFMAASRERRCNLLRRGHAAQRPDVTAMLELRIAA